MSTTTTPDAVVATFDLTPQQWQVIALLSDGKTVTATAEAAGVHRTTIHHWRRTQPQFALALHDTQSDLADHYRKATQARADKALTILDKILDDDRTPASVRLKAVLHVLNTATAVPVLDPVEAQLESKRQHQETRARRIQMLELEPEEDPDCVTSDNTGENPNPRFSPEIIAQYEAFEAQVASEEAREAEEEEQEAAAEADEYPAEDEQLDDDQPDTANCPSNRPIHHISSIFAGYARNSILPADVLAAILSRASETLPDPGGQRTK